MTEQNQDRLTEALRCLREDAAGKSAPDALEGALRQAFRQHQSASHQTGPAKPRRLVWVPAAIAASVALGVAWHISNPKQVNVEAPRVATVTAARTPAPRVTVKPAVMKSVRPKRRTDVKQYASGSKPAPRQEPFIQIPYAPAFNPYEDAQVVRVNIAGASVRRLGLPVTEDRVAADLVVGNDGLARAIRVVSNSGLNSYR
jgi:hypothetical protein